MAVDYIKREVSRMDWPEEIADPLGDAIREIKALRREVRFWRLYAISVLVIFAALVIALALKG